MELATTRFCTLHRRVRSNAVALCGLCQGPLDTYLRENPHLKQIILCLDADGPGQEAAEKFREEYVRKGYTVSTRTPAQGKDWNEYLQQRGAGQRKEGATPGDCQITPPSRLKMNKKMEEHSQ